MTTQIYIRNKEIKMQQRLKNKGPKSNFINQKTLAGHDSLAVKTTFCPSASEGRKLHIWIQKVFLIQLEIDLNMYRVKK